MNPRTLLPALALGVMLALAGCAGTVAGEASPAAPGPMTSTAPAFSAPTYSPPTTTTPPLPSSAGWGKTWTYTDLLAVSVSAPVTYQPSPYSAGHDRERGVKVTVTITNGSSQAFAPIGMQVAAVHEGSPASQIFDSANGLMGPPQTSVLPGKSVSFEVGFSVGAEPGEMQVEVTPGFDYVPAIFVGQG